MQKRGLMLIVFLVLLASSVSAFNFSTLAEPSPAEVYEGADQAFEISINNYNQSQKIKEIHVTLSKVNVTNVVLLPLTTWRENHNATYIRWFNGTVNTISKNDVFEFSAFIFPVLTDTNTTLIVTKINEDNSAASENHTITILDDTTPPNIISINPANGTGIPSNNANRLITANIQENESQIATVNYTYCNCTANSTNCTGAATTITLNCSGNNCNGTADFSSFNEGNYACYVVTAANNVGGTATEAGKIYFTGIPPSVFGVKPADDVYLVTDTVDISANVTDNETAVDEVYANITYPDGTTTILALNQAGGSDTYANTFTNALEGTYTVRFVANDTKGNINSSVITNFTLVPVYDITFTLKPSNAKPGRAIQVSGTVKLANGSDIPENKVAINAKGAETNVTLTNGSFSHTFNAPQNTGTYNIHVRVYANSGYIYSETKKLTVTSPVSHSSGWGADWGGYEEETEDAGTMEIEEPEPEPEPIVTEDAGTMEAPEEEQTPEEVIDQILSKPGNQITGSAVGLGGPTTWIALVLFLLGLGTLAYSNAKIRGHVHRFAKEKVGSKFKKKTKEDKEFSDQEWEDYFKRLKED
ncbi:hypothetical protein KY346_00885 [Candidatus Woesearchaeota archaeon]|nr:hypothetical protein [Candidatus Woesearchaeota archaeon]